MTPRSQKLVWSITVAVFTCLALWPLWSARFPPMQDYPQHLFHAQVLRAYNDPAFDYNKYYEVRLHPLYATFFLATLLFSQFASIETAGKLSLSLYPVLVALVILRLGRRARVAHGVTPWGALLFFPLAFNQQYFFGNLNYLFSLPILILALVDFEDVMERNLAVWPIVRHSLWQLALFITHPLTFLIYVAMAVVGAIITQRRTDRFWHKLAAAMALAVILLAIAWVVNKATSSAEVGAISWLTPRITLTFFALMFNGMQWSSGLDVVALMLWGAIFVILLGSLLLDWTKQGTSSLPVKNLVFLGGAFVAMLALPYGFGSFTYLNVRISAIIYFLIALLAAQVRFREWAAGVIVALLGVCMVQSMAKQSRLSAEVYEVVPIVQRNST